MMKKLALILALLCAMLLCASAMAEDADVTAPGTGFAVVAPENGHPTADLLGEDGRVLMHYYPGTPVEVLSLGEDGMAQVKVGDKDAWIEGTMRQSELRYGAEAAREVQRVSDWFSAAEGSPVYAQMDEGSEPILLTGDMETMIVGGYSDDGWLHIIWPYGGNYDDRGFMRTDGQTLGGASGMDSWSVPPVEGEATAEVIRGRAIEETLAHADELGLAPEETTREALEKLTFDVRLTYDVQTGKAQWTVWIDRDVCDNVSACTFDAQGTLIRVEHSNG